MKTYIGAFVVLVIVLVGQKYGIDTGLYVKMPEYDIPMHILGGLGIGLFACAIAKSGIIRRFAIKRKVLLAVFVVGLLWEALEAYFGIMGFTLWSKPYMLDTTADLINDMIGGAIAVWIACRRPLD